MTEKKRRRSKLKAAHLPEIRRLAAEGMSARWIGLAFGCSGATAGAHAGVRSSRHDPVFLARSYDGTESTAERAALAQRLGFPTVGALRAAVCYAKAGMRARGEEWWLPGETKRAPVRGKQSRSGGSTEPCP